jgi:hypothetical protein
MLAQAFHFTQLGLVLALLTSSGVAADQASAAEAKLRDSLRATMLQLRNAEAEKATLQATQADLEAKNKALSEQLESFTKQATTNQAEADRAIQELKAKVDERDREIGGMRVTLEKWKSDHQKLTDYARGREAERAKLAARVIVLDRQVADQRRRNQAMYKLGTEVLARYESFGLGTALTSREPFIGLTRVKFENLVQDYGDKLADERIQTSPSSSLQTASNTSEGRTQEPNKTPSSSPTSSETAEPAVGKRKPAR